jgi:hypothetical protein
MIELERLGVDERPGEILRPGQPFIDGHRVLGDELAQA